MGFLYKNAVAARQLPVLAHQRIFAVSADLPGIMDTAQIGGYRITPAVSPRLPIGKRLSWAVVSPQLKMGGYRITPAVSLRLPEQTLHFGVKQISFSLSGKTVKAAVSGL